MSRIEMPNIEVQNPRTIRWGILIMPGFPMLAYSALIEPLRAANIIAARKLYDWTTISASDQVLTSSSGLCVSADYTAENAPFVDRVVVVSGIDDHDFTSSSTLAWIRLSLRQGTTLGAVSDGAFYLARAGLLDGYRCTVHWRIQASFREAFPQVECQNDLYVFDRDRFSAAGGVSSVDMILAMIEQDHSKDLALAVSEWFVHTQRHEDEAQQSLSYNFHSNVSDSRVKQALLEMENHIEEPLTAEELASRLGSSVDTLERAFKREFGQTTMQYYRMLRFRRARDLLRSSSLPISEIAVACGFSDSSSFARAYRTYFGASPREYRFASL